MREAAVARATKETDIRLRIVLEGTGAAELDTGIGFFEHMLSAFARFAGVDLEVRCAGDLRVDAHHTVEDVGICLGQALDRALGTRVGIRRVGGASVPMDEALATAVLDVSGRPFLVFDAAFSAPMLGAMDAQLVEEFFRAVCVHAGLTLHLAVPYGKNDHHKAEALFKAFGRALEQAVALDPRIDGVLSTKGAL
jgi:imidazoleglycerol-phosphate dehydratase